jgi:hypothetical protein
VGLVYCVQLIDSQVAPPARMCLSLPGRHSAWWPGHVPISFEKLTLPKQKDRFVHCAGSLPPLNMVRCIGL